jgi:hypothetical protein
MLEASTTPGWTGSIHSALLIVCLLSDQPGETLHQFVTKTRLFKGHFGCFENRKGKGAKGFKGCHLKIDKGGVRLQLSRSEL